MRYFINNKQVTKAEAKEIEKKNMEIMSNGDFSKMKDIQFIITDNVIKKVAKIYSSCNIYFGDVFFYYSTSEFVVTQRGCNPCFRAKSLEEVERYIYSGKNYGFDTIKYLKVRL